MGDVALSVRKFRSPNVAAYGTDDPGMLSLSAVRRKICPNTSFLKPSVTERYNLLHPVAFRNTFPCGVTTK
jgi:hypothetical protein